MKKWQKVKIGDLLTRYKEPVEVRDDVLYKRVTIRTKHKGVGIRDEEIGKKIGTKKQWLVKEGQFILSRIDARFGAMGMIPKEVDGAIVTNDFLSFDVNKNTIEQYLFYQLLKSPIFLEACKKASRGVTQRKRINEDFFLGYELTIPRRDAQKELCAKIELAEKGQETLKNRIENQKTYLKNLKKQILQDAIEGKLTKEWRRKNPDIESASELLKKIKKEKEKLIAKKKIKKEKPLPAINESEIPFELPHRWVWTRLGEIGVTQTGTTPPTEDESNFGNHIPFIKPADIKVEGIIDYSNEGLSEKGLMKGRLITSGSVLVVCIGGSIGKLAECKIDVSCNQQINVISPIIIRGSFVKYVLSSVYFQKLIWSNASGATTPIINKSKWENILIPLPTILEQHAIVSKLQTLMQKLDEAEKQIEKSLENSKLLTKTILAEAFKGE